MIPWFEVTNRTAKPKSTQTNPSLPHPPYTTILLPFHSDLSFHLPSFESPFLPNDPKSARGAHPRAHPPHTAAGSLPSAPWPRACERIVASRSTREVVQRSSDASFERFGGSCSVLEARFGSNWQRSRAITIRLRNASNAEEKPIKLLMLAVTKRTLISKPRLAPPKKDPCQPPKEIESRTNQPCLELER